MIDSLAYSLFLDAALPPQNITRPEVTTLGMAMTLGIIVVGTVALFYFHERCIRAHEANNLVAPELREVWQATREIHNTHLEMEALEQRINAFRARILSMNQGLLAPHS